MYSILVFLTKILTLVFQRNAMKSIANYLFYFKYLGLSLVAIGLVTIIFDKSKGAEIPLLVGLFTILVASERVEDERTRMIKTTSLYIAFILSYGGKLLTTNLFEHGIIGFQLVDKNHFLILVLSMTNLIYYSRMFVIRS